MIGLNQGWFLGYVHKSKYFVNKKDHPQIYLTIQQPNPNVKSQKGRGRASIYGRFVAFGEQATQIRDKLDEGDFVFVHYTLRNQWGRGPGGMTHALQVVSVYPWRPHRTAKKGDDGSWEWGEIVDGRLAQHLPEEEDGGDRAWSFKTS